MSLLTSPRQTFLDSSGFVACSDLFMDSFAPKGEMQSVKVLRPPEWAPQRMGSKCPHSLLVLVPVTGSPGQEGMRNRVLT